MARRRSFFPAASALALLIVATAVLSPSAAAGPAGTRATGARPVLRGQGRRLQSPASDPPTKKNKDKCKVKKIPKKTVKKEKEKFGTFRDRPVRRDPGALHQHAKAAKESPSSDGFVDAVIKDPPEPKKKPPKRGPPKGPSKESRLEPAQDDTGLGLGLVYEWENVCDEEGNLLPGMTWGRTDVLDTDGHVVGLDPPGGTSEETGEPAADTDSDGLADYEEDETYGTDKTDEDTDGDGLSDGKEVEWLGTE